MALSEMQLPIFPDHARDIFYTPPSGSDTWRELLAFDPCDSFILEKIEDLPALIRFIQEHEQQLCAGFVSYDLGMDLLQVKSRHGRNCPLAVFHAYDSWSERINSQWRDQDGLPIPVRQEQPPSPEEPLQFSLSVDLPAYRQAIAKILDHIRAGEFYQINLTQQLRGSSSVQPRSLFKQLYQQHPAEHACYFEGAGLAIHSLSPELFLQHTSGTLRTEPIKGTRPRGADDSSDLKNRDELLSSAKEQAELFMITDLLRNDLGKVSQIGSVTLKAVKELKGLQKVWHTCSQIEGRLLNDLHPFEALLSMLPGGSITGCPKKRAVQAIDALETSARGIYTGALGCILPGDEFSFNIAIRTLIQNGCELTLGTGGGITIDSNWQNEWDELLIKATTFQQRS